MGSQVQLSAQPIFELTLDQTGYEIVKGIEVQPNGDVILAISHNDSVGRSYLVRIRQNGSLGWLYQFPAGMSAEAMSKGPGESFYLTLLDGPLSGLRKGICLRLDASANVLWQREFAGNLGMKNFKVVSHGDRFLVVSGATGAGSSWGPMLAGLVDSSGTVHWEKTFPFVQDGNPRPLELDDKDAIYVGYGSTNGSGLVRLDTSGNVIWQKKYLFGMQDIKLQGDSVLYAVGGYTGNFGSIAKIGSGGELETLWTTNSTWNWDIQMGPSGGFFMVGMAYDLVSPFTFRTSYVQHFDPATSMWKWYSMSYNSTIRTMRRYPGGGFAITCNGLGAALANKTILLRTKNDFSTHCSTPYPDSLVLSTVLQSESPDTTTIVPSSSSQAGSVPVLSSIAYFENFLCNPVLPVRDAVGEQAWKMYPNPAREVIYLEPGKVAAKLKNIRVSLLDATGRTMASWNRINAESMAFDVGHLSRGVYYLQVSGSRRPPSVKAVVLQ